MNLRIQAPCDITSVNCMTLAPAGLHQRDIVELSFPDGGLQHCFHTGVKLCALCVNNETQTISLLSIIYLFIYLCVLEIHFDVLKYFLFMLKYTFSRDNTLL